MHYNWCTAIGALQLVHYDWCTTIGALQLSLPYVRVVHHFMVCILASSTEQSNLYLKLFKLVFGSVSLFATENEQMLKVSSSLHDMHVKRS